MALTKTIDEIKEMLPNFISNLGDENSFPNFAAAEYKNLVPITGIALYNDIHNKYNNAPGTMTSTENDLLKKMRLVAVCYAYYDGLALGHLTLTDNGVRKFVPKDTVPVAKWEYEKLQATLINTAMDATEVLLTFLFNNTADFALWTASMEYKSVNSLLIKTGTEFNNLYSLFQPMTTYFNIRNVVATAQEQYLQDAIGKKLLNYILQKQAPDDTLAGIITKLKKALAFFTIAKCCRQYSVRFSLEGFTVMSDGGNPDSADHTGRKTANADELYLKMHSAEKDGSDFMARAKYDLVTYSKATTGDVPDAEFTTAFGSGPLLSYEDPGTASSGNEGRKGVFVM